MKTKRKSLLTKDELLSAVNGAQIGNAECFFCDVRTDSRELKNGAENEEFKAMFAPLVGKNVDGHVFIKSAVEKAPGVILLNNSEYESKSDFYDELAKKYDEICFVRINDTLRALQDAAAAYVEKKCENMIKVSVTGSNGKTTTKEMLVSVCKEFFGEDKVAYTKGNLNSETGLPLSVFKIRGDEKIGIFEMGMNREGEIEEISRVLKPKYGIITNIGTAHIGFLKTRKNIATEKRRSFDFIPRDGAAFVCADDDFADYCAENAKGEIVKFGKSVPFETSGVKFLSDNGIFGTDFTVDGEKVHLNLAGEYNFQNALAVAAFAKKIGIDAVSIKKGLEKVRAAEGRTEIFKIVLKNHKKSVLIKDCYNANLDSMLKALDFSDNLDENDFKKRIFVLADMKELGDESENSHKKIGEKINRIKSDFTFLVGPEMNACYEILKNKTNVLYFDESSPENFEIIGEKILEIANGDDLILLKGSNSMQLEQLIPFFAFFDE